MICLALDWEADGVDIVCRRKLNLEMKRRPGPGADAGAGQVRRRTVQDVPVHIVDHYRLTVSSIVST